MTYTNLISLDHFNFKVLYIKERERERELLSTIKITWIVLTLKNVRNVADRSVRNTDQKVFRLICLVVVPVEGAFDSSGTLRAA